MLRIVHLKEMFFAWSNGFYVIRTPTRVTCTPSFLIDPFVTKVKCSNMHTGVMLSDTTGHFSIFAYLNNALKETAEKSLTQYGQITSYTLERIWNGILSSKLCGAFAYYYLRNEYHQFVPFSINVTFIFDTLPEARECGVLEFLTR